MFAGSHAETGDERKAGVALLPHVIGNIQTAAGYGPLRRASGAGGFGMLWLTALTFSMIREVQAADPNVTFLDNGDVNYKDLEHGSFELVTKEAIPRHIIVEDPGKTIVLHAQGSSVSVNQVTNSPARMAELQAAQQDALATYEKGLGSTGSSTPPFADSLPVEPINFIQPDNGPPALNSLPLLQAASLSVPEVIFGKLLPPSPTPPTLNAVLGPTEIDTVAFDLFTATSGTFLASSANGSALTFGISGGTAGSTVLNGVTYDVSKAGPYGTLYVDSATGGYTFVPDNGAINALTAPTTTDFTITVSDGTLSATEDFPIAINGVNDAAIISGATTGAAIEAGGVANTSLAALTATGKLADADVDNAPNTFTAVSAPTASEGGYGTFTMTADGVWTYTLNEGNSAVQALNVGGTLTDTFTVTTEDGTPQVVTITIKGANDAAIISGATTGSVIEAGDDACAKTGTSTATGKLTDTDVDNTPNTFTPVGSPKESDAGYGTFKMTADGVWTYTLDNDNCAVQKLNVGDTLTDTFTVTTVDGTAQVVTITIDGSNDAAIICGKTTGSVTEAGCDEHGKPTATGKLADTDVDNAPNTFTPVSSPTASDAGYGTFKMTAAGVWTYTLDNNNCAVQALDDCDTLTDTFTVTTVDGTPQVVTITIHGTDDGHHNDDKHDFDSFVIGAKEISDPPPVDKAPGDAVAVASAETAAGNDTQKGNNGDDAIGGDSGSSTINGNIASGLGDSFYFKAEISALDGSGVIGPADVNFTPAPISHHEDEAHGQPATSEGAQAIELSPLGQQAADNFNFVPERASVVAAHAAHDLML
jgi:VCBS repeat-containing protein